MKKEACVADIQLLSWCLSEKTRKAHQDRQCHSQGLNWVPDKYKSKYCSLNQLAQS